jgi:predicted O-methyltransferase YrrM
MLIKKHWTFRYIFNRTKNYFFEKKNKDLPWLTPDSIKLLRGLIQKSDIGLEYGSGRSTAWLAKRCKFLTSYEDNKKWYAKVRFELDKLAIKNTEYFFKESLTRPAKNSDYVTTIYSFENDSLDFILIDGNHRGLLAREAIKKVKLGGLLIIDNIERSLPYKTWSPHSIYGKPEKLTKTWSEFERQISTWRKIMTSNGVTDTAIFIKRG